MQAGVARYPAQARGFCEAGLMRLTESAAILGAGTPPRMVALPFTCLPYHLDEHFSGF